MQRENAQAQRDAPEICTRCGYYKPQFYRVINKECAAFGTTQGVKDNRCGAWCKRTESGKEKGRENEI